MHVRRFSLLTSSLEALVCVVAPAEVESAVEGSNTQEEDDDGLRVALPVNDWVHLVVHVEEAEVVGEEVEESVPGHHLPVGRQQLNVSEVDVHPGHKQWSCVQNDHVSSEEVCRGVPGGWAWLVLDLNDENWSQNDPEAEGDGQVEAVGYLEPSEGNNMPVLWVARSQERQDLRNDGVAPAPVGPVVEVVHLLTLVRN